MESSIYFKFVKKNWSRMTPYVIMERILDSDKLFRSFIGTRRDQLIYMYEIKIERYSKDEEFEWVKRMKNLIQSLRGKKGLKKIEDGIMESWNNDLTSLKFEDNPALRDFLIDKFILRFDPDEYMNSWSNFIFLGSEGTGIQVIVEVVGVILGNLLLLESEDYINQYSDVDFFNISDTDLINQNLENYLVIDKYSMNSMDETQLDIYKSRMNDFLDTMVEESEYAFGCISIALAYYNTESLDFFSEPSEKEKFHKVFPYTFIIQPMSMKSMLIVFESFLKDVIGELNHKKREVIHKMIKELQQKNLLLVPRYDIAKLAIMTMEEIILFPSIWEHDPQFLMNKVYSDFLKYN
jgi:hypothetical protein